jgi:hypothetical protein
MEILLMLASFFTKENIFGLMYPIKNDPHRNCGHVISEYIDISIGPVSS